VKRKSNLIIICFKLTLLFAWLVTSHGSAEELVFQPELMQFNATSKINFSPESLIVSKDFEQLYDKSKQCWGETKGEKCFFYMQYAYLKRVSRDSIQIPQTTVTTDELKISSFTPLKELLFTGIELPLSFLTRLNKNKFELTLDVDQLRRIIPNQDKYTITVIDLAANRSDFNLSTNHLKSNQNIPPALSVYGIPCKHTCITAYAEILKELTTHLPLIVIDISNQQKVFNESILCDADVIRDCNNQLINSKVNDLNFQALNNQWIFEFRGGEEHQGWFTAELLVAHYSALTLETYLTTSLFSREKSVKRVIKNLAEKMRIIVQLNL
jgi:hypothetical protein